MTEKMMKIVHNVRTTVYLILVVLIIIAGVKSYLHAEESQEEGIESFWPCDWIPHPHPPASPPDRGNDA